MVQRSHQDNKACGHTGTQVKSQLGFIAVEAYTTYRCWQKRTLENHSLRGKKKKRERTIDNIHGQERKDTSKKSTNVLEQQKALKRFH